MKTNKLTIVAGLAVSTAALFFVLLKFGSSLGIISENPNVPTTDTDSAVNIVDTDTEQTAIPQTVTLRAVGDNLIDINIFTDAKNRGSDGKYDFSNAYKNIEEVIKSADIAMISQETVVNKTNKASGSPLYNTPTDLGDKLVDMGFDVFSLASNHVLDQGANGALEAIEYWDSKNVIRTGIYEDASDLKTVRIQQVNGIKFAYVSITSHLSGLSVDPDKTSLKVLSLTDPYKSTDEVYEEIKNTITLAEEVADIVIVSMHWRQENVTTVPSGQVDFAEYLVECGADVIIGSGPQVLQPISWIEKPDASGEALCIYSLGNFISGSKSMNNLLSAIAEITFEKNSAGGVDISSIGLIPIVTHYEDNLENPQICLFDDYTEDLAKEHGASDMSYTKAKDFFDKMIGNEYLRKFN